MPSDERLVSEQFPRASQYHPEWVLANASGGANSLWLTEWLATALDLRPGMRVLDLGCGRASSSIFLRREFGVQVWATDLWFSAAENIQRIRDAGVEDGVFPLHADARSLPFAPDFFDAIVCIDSFPYFGSDDLYLNYLAQFVKPGGPIGIAGAGLVREIEGEVPEHLRAWWTQDLWAFHSAAWWRRHWERTGIVEVELAETMPDGWKLWLDWHRAVAPDNATEIKAIEDDGGRFIGYVRVVGRRRGEAKLEEYCWPDTLRSLPAAVHEEAVAPQPGVVTEVTTNDFARKHNDQPDLHPRPDACRWGGSAAWQGRSNATGRRAGPGRAVAAYLGRWQDSVGEGGLMIEGEWLASEDPAPMLRYLRTCGSRQERFGLLGGGFCRLIWGKRRRKTAADP